MPKTAAKHLPKTIRIVWIWTSLLVALGGVILAGGSWLLGAWFAPTFWHVIAVILLVLTLIITIIDLAFVNYRWQFNTYLVNPRQFELHDGYFFRKQTVIPIAQIQNIKLEQGPLLRTKNLQAITLVTAASSHKIAGIPTAESEQFKTLVMTLAQEARDDA
ncbi:PH domain-containing protein [Lactiplantibacillus daowaiensis]|uniref:PH domain-containing protein n=1 Tax=Lactiplantibacillus daowaiensis TaxID=2559918 RepID=A0ABW1S057_9LACO|nr:PH domain-containing protein [Lactiplantibacillus daowaiensis]